jgi:hypothetical protein
MGTSHETSKKFEPTSPFAPPKPDEATIAENTDAEPMAVANDKLHKDESFHPTTQDGDQMDAEVASSWRDRNMDAMRRRAKDAKEENE